MGGLKTVIVGCGKVAHIHAKVMNSLEDTRFAAVFSRSSEKGEAFAGKYGVSAYSHLEEMFEKEKPDIAVICTPHPFHIGPVIEASRRGIHVLVEKPLASNLEDCDRMIEAAEKGGVALGVVFQRRWYPPVRRMKKAIDEGRIGKPVLGMVTVLGWRDRAYYDSDPWRGTWDEEGGGVLVNQAPHQLDLLQWFMGPITEVYGKWKNFNHPYIEVDDTAAAVVHFSNGGIATVTVSNSQNPPLYGNVHIFGESGAGIGVETDRGAMFIAGMSEIEHAPVNDLWSIEGGEKLSDLQSEDDKFFKSLDPMTYFHSLSMKDFVQAVKKKRSPLVDGKEARKTVELFTAIYRSSQSGLPVTFPL